MGRFAFIKRPGVFVPATICLLVLVLVGIGFYNLNSPAEGTVTRINYNNTQAIPRGPQKYSDQYLSFSYPGSFELAPADQGGGYLDVINLVSQQRRDEYASIGITRESLGTDSSITYRAQHPDLYKEISAPDNSEVFAKDDSKEYTGFIAHDSLVISISFTSVVPMDLSREYNMIADSLQWKQ